MRNHAYRMDAGSRVLQPCMLGRCRHGACDGHSNAVVATIEFFSQNCRRPVYFILGDVLYVEEGAVKSDSKRVVTVASSSRYLPLGFGVVR